MYSNVTEQSSEGTGNHMHHVIPMAKSHSVACTGNLFLLASDISDTLNCMQHYHLFSKKAQQQLNHLGLCFMPVSILLFAATNRNQ